MSVHYRTVVGGYRVEPGMHFRPAGRVTGWIEPGRGHHRSADERTLLVRAIRWRETARIRGPVDDGWAVEYLEWFRRGAVALTDRPVLALKHLKHGGSVVGSTLALFDEPYGLDAVVDVAASPIGDGVLDLVARNGRVPTSIGFFQPRGGFVLHDGRPPGVERTRVELFEIAIVAEGAYAGSYVAGPVGRPSNGELAKRVSARLPALAGG